MDTTENALSIMGERHVQFADLITPIMAELVGSGVDIEIVDHKWSTYCEFIYSLSNKFTYYVDKMDSNEAAAYHWSFDLPPINGRVEIDFSLPLSLRLWDFIDKERSGTSILNPRLIAKAGMVQIRVTPKKRNGLLVPIKEESLTHPYRRPTSHVHSFSYRPDPVPT